MKVQYIIKNRFLSVVKSGYTNNLNELISKFRDSSIFKLEIKEDNTVFELYNF